MPMSRVRRCTATAMSRRYRLTCQKTSATQEPLPKTTLPPTIRMCPCATDVVERDEIPGGAEPRIRPAGRGRRQRGASGAASPATRTATANRDRSPPRRLRDRCTLPPQSAWEQHPQIGDTRTTISCQGPSFARSCLGGAFEVVRPRMPAHHAHERLINTAARSASRGRLVCKPRPATILATERLVDSRHRLQPFANTALVV